MIGFYIDKNGHRWFNAEEFKPSDRSQGYQLKGHDINLIALELGPLRDIEHNLKYWFIRGGFIHYKTTEKQYMAGIYQEENGPRRTFRCTLIDLTNKEWNAFYHDAQFCRKAGKDFLMDHLDKRIEV